MAGSPPSPLRMRPSVEFAEPRTLPLSHASTTRRTGAAHVTPRRPHTEFGVPGALSLSSSGSSGSGSSSSSGCGSEPRPILLHQTSHVRISSPLRKQVGFDDKPRLRPALKNRHSGGSVDRASLGALDASPKLSLRERRGRGRAQVSWAQTIAVPHTSSDFLEELTTAHPGRSGLSNDGHSIISRRSFSNDGHSSAPRPSTSFDSERPVLRASRSLSVRGRPGNRPSSAAGSTSSGPAGLWFDVPVPAAPHPSTCMPGFPSQEFPDHRPPKFSRDLLRRPGVIMPKAAPRASMDMPRAVPRASMEEPRTAPRASMDAHKGSIRPVSIATEFFNGPRRQSIEPPQRPPATSRMPKFLTRKLSKLSASPQATLDAPVPMLHVSAQPVPIPQAPVSRPLPIAPAGRFPSPGPTPPHRFPATLPRSFGSHRPGVSQPQHLQLPQQTMPARVRGTTQRAGGAHFLPPGAAPTLPPHMPNAVPTHGSPIAHALPPGAMAARPDMMHGISLPLQPPHVLSQRDAVGQALRHYGSSPALQVTSPPHAVPGSLPPQRVGRFPPVPVSPLGASPPGGLPHGLRPSFDDQYGPNYARPRIHAATKQSPVARAPHLSVDFGSDDIWADLENSFGGLSLPDLPAEGESPGSPGSDGSHTTTATATTMTRDTHTTFAVPERDGYSEIGHARSTYSEVGHDMYSEMGHSRDTYPAVGHSRVRVAASVGHLRVGYSEIGHSHLRAVASDANHARAAPIRRAASSDLGHTAPIRRAASSDLGHSGARIVTQMQHRDVFSEAGHGGFERMYSPPSSPVRGKATQRAASESECTMATWSPRHKLSSSAPGTPVFGTMGSLPPRGESLVASSLGATSNRPMYATHMLNTLPVRTSSRSPSSMSLRSSTSMASESTISSLPSTMTSMTTASSAASVEMPDSIAEDENDCLDVFGMMPKEYEREPWRPAQMRDEHVQIRQVQRARSSVATLRVRSAA